MSSKKIGASNTFFGPSLRKARKFLGLTQAKFAEPLSISGSYVSNLEKSEATPSEAVIREIVNTYRISRVFLETGKGEIFTEVETDEFGQGPNTRMEVDEETVITDVIAEAQTLYTAGTIKLSFFDEALFYMMHDLPEDARRRVQKDIIMEWIAAKRKSPTV